MHTSLWFTRGNPAVGSAAWVGPKLNERGIGPGFLTVILCDREFCRFCEINLPEDFTGGELLVDLVKITSFVSRNTFFVAHLLVQPAENNETYEPHRPEFIWDPEVKEDPSPQEMPDEPVAAPNRGGYTSRFGRSW